MDGCYLQSSKLLSQKPIGLPFPEYEKMTGATNVFLFTDTVITFDTLDALLFSSQLLLNSLLSLYNLR